MMAVWNTAQQPIASPKYSVESENRDSQGIGGRIALDCLIKVQGIGFVSVVEMFCRERGAVVCVNVTNDTKITGSTAHLHDYYHELLKWMCLNMLYMF